jgi:hypothetical protein
LNGLGGNALLGTLMMVFIALRNFSNASGPSIISGWGFISDSIIRHEENSMPVIRFIGRIYPSVVAVSMNRIPGAQFVGPPGTPLEGLQATFECVIDKSQVEVVCSANRTNVPHDWEQLHLSAFELARSTVDLMAFAIGYGLTLVMDSATSSDGRSGALLAHDAGLPPLCTAFRVNQERPDGSLEEMLHVVMREQAIMVVLNDLTSTMEAPYRVPVNCARAVEGIVQLISPGKESRQRWINLRQVLNLTENHLMPITETSKGPRHGNYFETSSIPLVEVRYRAWTVMNRFLEYRKRGNTPLPISEFPPL